MIAPIKFDLELKLDDVPIRLHMDNGIDLRTQWTSARHCNADYEVHILLSGSCTVFWEDTAHELHAGSAILIPPGIFHYPANLSPDFERFTFSFTLDSGALSDHLMDQLSQCADCVLSPAAMLLCRNIVTEIYQQELFRQDALNAMLTYLLIQLFRYFRVDYAARSPHETNTAALRTVIIDKFFSPWPNAFGSEEELAQQLHVSRRHLNRILQQYYGVNFRQKMRQARMENAGWLLQTTGKEMSEIAYLTGYAAESSFYKAFKAYYRMTPQKYRQKYK